MSFCNLALRLFHLFVVPATSAVDLSSDATLWIVPAAGFARPSATQIKNAFNYCFSMAPHRFEFSRINDTPFSTVAANGNIARFIVARGRCVVGKVSLLLFPTRDSTMAASACLTLSSSDASGDHGDVSSQFF